ALIQWVMFETLASKLTVVFIGVVLFDSVFVKKAHSLLDDTRGRAELIHYQQAGSLSQCLDEIKGFLFGVLWFELGWECHEESCVNRLRDLMSSMLAHSEGLMVD
ncbi:hypothetical protein, partial [Marinobacter alexandrii]|uniref:hypothetical protein n=1 Tax=Marinobacter alexandrii TaxID=2570351 RepID=UPI003265FBF0